MISGPFTDEIVRMLRGSEKEPPVYGDVLLNGEGLYGIYGHGLVYVSTETVHAVKYCDFAVKDAYVLSFPEPFDGGFRMVSAFGTVWIPEFSEEERDFLQKSGYMLYSAADTVGRIKSVLGKKRHPFYPLSCKTGLMRESDAAQLAKTLQKIM